jgi:hypothetical protein
MDLPFLGLRHAVRCLGYAVVSVMCACWPALAQSPDPLAVHLVHMGGNDCPPCVAWRLNELPKLEQSEIFKSIQFSYVTKPIRSAVPASFFLPAEVKPLKDKLDIASGGGTGSPQGALIVGGEVVDYWFGARSAADIEDMIVAVKTGGKYPFKRCVQRGPKWSCVKAAGDNERKLLSKAG